MLENLVFNIRTVSAIMTVGLCIGFIKIYAFRNNHLSSVQITNVFNAITNVFGGPKIEG